MTKSFQIASDTFWNEIDEFCKAFGNQCGVYSILSVKDDRPVPISRLLGIDNEGILYIGKAESYLDRVISLKKSISPKHIGKGHEFGVRYKNHLKVSELFPYESLHATLELSDNPRVLEQDKLTSYYKKFGELPPLNRNM